MFPAVLGTLTAVSLLALSPMSQGSYVTLETESETAKVGDIYSVDVYVFAAEPINAVELELQYTSGQGEVFGIDRGQSVITLWTEEPIVTDSTIAFRGGTFQRGFIGKHLIATVNFRAEETGAHEVSIGKARLIAGDGIGTEVSVSSAKPPRLSVIQYDEHSTENDFLIITTDSKGTDLDEDGKVSLRDMSVFVGAWSNKTAVYDFSGDGQMNFTDFSILLSDLFLR